MDEKWKPIEGSYYSVSSSGKIRNDKFGKLLNGCLKNGYRRFTLRMPVNGKMENVHVTPHRLVASHFISPIPSGYEVHHKDADRLNNAVDNLEIIQKRVNLATKKYQSVLECPCCGCKINMVVTGTMNGES